MDARATAEEEMKGLGGLFQRWATQTRKHDTRRHRPLVTVSYAQSVDGSIASRSRGQILLSSRDSLVLTHRIRAACDAIVIGINTVLADNPLLTVRLTEGASPQPLVLDTHLRIPPEARLLSRNDHPCWIACGNEVAGQQSAPLEERGAEILRCPRDQEGRVDLPSLLDLLGERGVRSLMVEGGAQVITSFIEARLVDHLIITIAPRLVGGLPVLERPAVKNGASLALRELTFEPCGPDLILWGQPEWREP